MRAASTLPALVLLAVTLFVAFPRPSAGQSPAGSVRLALPDGEPVTLRPERHRGYPAVPAGGLQPMGWTGEDGDSGFVLRHRTGLELRFRPGSPFFWWDGDPVQMVHPPYRLGERVYLPVQLLVDLFPAFLPDAYRWDASAGVLQVEGAPLPATGGGDPPREEEETRHSRLVVVDPGHGGHDTGAVGAGGIREKDVALSVGLALARELGADSTLEVRLVREADEFVPLWERGAQATEWKEERPGVFVSIHANALGGRSGVRGFETYFLAEARTEHEQRVAAAENASMNLDRGGDTIAGAWEDPLLDDILRDLRTFDHQHWSALLAEMVQEELGGVHPGPDRGVKQAPLAVITNSLMPSVLVEVGFLTHTEEARLLSDPGFHRESARALARAVRRFLERYPPGSNGP